MEKATAAHYSQGYCIEECSLIPISINILHLPQKYLRYACSVHMLLVNNNYFVTVHFKLKFSEWAKKLICINYSHESHKPILELHILCRTAR